MFQKKYIISSSDVDPFLDLRLSCLMRILQDIAIEDAERLGVGKSKTIDKGMFWIVARYSISLFKAPKYLEEVFLKTYPGNDMKFLYPRYFEVTSLSNEPLARVSSTWVVINKSDRKVNMNPFNGFTLPGESYVGEEPLCKKINYNELEFIEEREVRFSETDMNSHLNNTKYLDYIFDTHNLDFYKNNQVDHFSINFNLELLSGDKVSLFRGENNGAEIVAGFKDNKNIFVAEISYEKRK